MIHLYDKKSGSVLGSVTAAQLQFLIDQLEETSSTDQDYYIDEPTLEMLQDAGAEPSLIELLRTGLATRPGFEVRWEKE